MPGAVDTNVLVRFLVDDGSEHVGRSRRLFEAGTIFVPASVMLESEWVLRSNFGFGRDAVCDAFDRLLNIASVIVQESETLSLAVATHRKGMDFADAIHLHSSLDCDAFFTFDANLKRVAAKLPHAIKVTSP